MKDKTKKVTKKKSKKKTARAIDREQKEAFMTILSIIKR
jgi:hypothetical protein